MADQQDPNGFNLFGFQIKRAKDNLQPKSFIPASLDDGGTKIEVNAGVNAAAYNSFVIDLDPSAIQSEAELIKKYRELSLVSDIDIAIDEIVNEVVIYDEYKAPVTLDFSEDLAKGISEKTKEVIKEEFESTLQMLNFGSNANEIVRTAYVDGRIAYHKVLNKDNVKGGIIELRPIDSAKLKKIVEIKKVKDPQSQVDIVVGQEEYYIYSERGFSGNEKTGLKIASDAIAYCAFGPIDGNTGNVLSYLHKCLTGDTRVKTQNGWINLSDISVGDSILSYNTTTGSLEPTVVTTKWNNGKKQIVQVRSAHTSFKCTTDHPVYVKNKNTGECSYIEAGELINKTHQLCLPKIISGVDVVMPTLDRQPVIEITNPEVWIAHKMKGKKKFIFELAEKFDVNKHSLYSSVYGYKPMEKVIAEKLIDAMKEIGVEFETVERYVGNYINDLNVPDIIDEDFAKLFGFLLGDGWIINRPDQHTIGFAQGVYPELNDLYSSLMEKYFGTCKLVIGKNRKSIYHSYYSGSVLGVELLLKLGFISGAKNKRIPSWVFSAKHEIQRAFIQGLMDADGCDRTEQSGGMWAYTIGLANEYLIKDIKELWTQMGFCSGKISEVRQNNVIISNVPVKHKETVAWTLYLSERNLPDFESILSVDSLPEEEVFDIEVQHQEHNFIANGAVVHNCIRPFNQLRMMEDSEVIYRMVRAPQRRIFYIDTNGMTKTKGEQYIKDVMARYKNKQVYDAATGTVKDSVKHLSILEDFWLPRNSSGKGTEITTLEGGPPLGPIENVTYFQNKLYQALNIPLSRLQPGQGTFNMGRENEISRDEVKFAKFVDKLRRKLNKLFLDVMETNIIIKGIATSEDWEAIKPHLMFNYVEDNFYSEIKESEMLKERIMNAQLADPFVGKYFSKRKVQREILRLTDDEISELEAENQEDMLVQQKLEMDVLNKYGIDPNNPTGQEQPK